MQAFDHPYLRGGFAAMAHRGGWLEPQDVARENSVHAFSRAVELGFRYLEVDVRTTADGELVVFHDSDLDRATDATGRIVEHTWADLAGVRIGGTDPIPRLDELLEQFPDTRFNIDVKEARAVAPLVAAIERAGAARRVCVASFSTARLRAFRAAAPGVCTAVSPRGVAWATHAFGLRRVLSDGGQALQVPVRYPGAPLPLVRPDVVRIAHARGRAVHVWTVNDEASMHHLLDLGVDGLVSDDITTLKRVLLERGLWEGEQ